MLKVDLVSLADGQSYRDVEICEDEDLDKLGIERVFENWTKCLFADNKCLIVHHWNIKVIRITREIKRIPNTTKLNRLILFGDIIYQDVSLVKSEDWEAHGIPEFFTKRDGIAGQMAWVCQEGTFVTHDTNVISLVNDDPRKKGITSSAQSRNVVESEVDTVNGKISH